MTRLRNLPTLRINMDSPRFFNYRGKTFQGLAGDTVATGLYANGIRVFSRSLKYHRPRGLYSLAGECANAMMEVNGVPNVQTETTFLTSGMIVKPQNVKGSPEFDLMGFMDSLRWAMPTGFYYRMFHKPARLWPIAARQIRKAAGLGTLSPNFTMTGRFDEIYPRAEVCVIGGGPAGMTAALAAAAKGLRVILLESRPWLGGAFEYRATVDSSGRPLFERAGDLVREVKSAANIRVFTHAPVIGVYSDGQVTAFQHGSVERSFDARYIQIRANSVVVATGCIERPLLFENNERPGVMQVECALRLARTWGILPGSEGVFSIGHDLGLEAAISLYDLGMKVAMVADSRECGQDLVLLDALAQRRISFLKGWVARKVHGRQHVDKVVLSSIKGGINRTVTYDLLVASAGLTPATGPLTLAEVKLRYDEQTGFFLPKSLPFWLHVAGRILGFNDFEAITTSGRLAGLKASTGYSDGEAPAILDCEMRLQSLPGPVRGSKFVFASCAGKKTFICFDEDTTLKDVDQAMAMGFDMPELIKRFTSAGTGPSQGGISGHNLPLYVNETGRSSDPRQLPTVARPPLVPTLLATYAGSNHNPSKRTPLYAIQVADGGQIERVGEWKRARRFSADVHCHEEIRNVRTNVGMLDASTLGKFRIFGPDALKVLQRVYVSDMSRITSGKAKYSAMCNEDGCLADDGVIVQTGEEDYYFTTTTGRAEITVEWIRYHTRFDNWDFGIVDLTDAYGVITIAGPNARILLSKVADADVSNETFPYMGYREITINRVAVRTVRLGFVGELSYELHVPASWTLFTWALLMDVGRDLGIQNFGLEAQNALRLDKGHIIIGSESEQRTTLHDLGLSFLWYRNKPEAKTVGEAALRHTEHQKGRLKLVGFKMEKPWVRPPKDGSVIVDRRVRGYVCTARFSVALKEPVGMALVEDELAVEGNRLAVYEDDCHNNLIYANVVPRPFYDPNGERLKR